jgi:predicted SAM-dependent methyltransferase
MNYLNIGCGTNYSTNKGWTNLDFFSTTKDVIAHNLLKGIPFEDERFDVVYHSHVLEHFAKQDGEKLIKECCRVLKKEGIVRIAIPDLEQIVRKYLFFLEKGILEPDNLVNQANYNWMMLEMYDQTVRNQSGGEMVKYLFQDKIANEDFVYERIGEEGRVIRNRYLERSPVSDDSGFKLTGIRSLFASLRKKLMRINEKYYDTGYFRYQGEIHQWMYDRYSLTLLLKKCGFRKIEIKTAFTSNISNWAEFELDGKNNIVRKPDSLFIEAFK